jgi:phage tail sheath protein FI
MPEYLAPGVYVEEVSFRSKSIEGVSTTTTGFIGPTRYGPVDLVPDVITSLVEFERIYGDRQQIVFAGSARHNYMWHAVRQFFENGGKRLYVSRVYRTYAKLTEPPPVASPPSSPLSPPAFPAGYASATLAPGPTFMPLVIAARFPGAGGNLQVRMTLTGGPNVFAVETKPGGVGTVNVVRGIVDGDLVLITPIVGPVADNLSLAERYISAGAVQYRFRRGGTATELNALGPTAVVRVITATVTVTPPDPNVPSLVYTGLALDRKHRRNGANDSLDAQFALEQPSLGRARSIPIVVWTGSLQDGIALAGLVIALRTSIGTALVNEKSSDAERSYDLGLTGGTDGDEPEVTEYEGIGGDPDSKAKSGLKALEDIDEVSIVAAPGSTFNFQTRSAQALAVVNALISHATRMRYRIAVVDAGDKQSIADVRLMRGKMDTTYAAFYFPWIKIVDPVTLQEIDIPPSGSVAGIYARNDINRGVFKAPANEVVETAVGLELILNKAQQDILNPAGINCFRFFENRGFRLWGARTATSDPEWKYVNLRRYFAYLEHSIDKGTQWAVFEPNGERLWANIRITISDFLFNEWTNGALLGDRPEKAFFVKCDRSTMTQNDLDNGRLVCLVGVAPLRPAEFVIIRIGQFTADRKV